MIVITAISCSHESKLPTPSSPLQVIYPLAVGNYWIYVDSAFSPARVDTTQFEITGTTEILFQNQELEVFWGDYVNRPDPEDVKWLFRNEDEGFFRYGGISNEDTLLVRNLTFKFPASAEDSWEFFVFGYDYLNNAFSIYDTLIFKCVSTNSILQTPLGNFECYVYKYSLPGVGHLIKPDILTFDLMSFMQLPFQSSSQIQNWDYYLYYAPDIGPVGAEGKQDDKIYIKRVILSYHLN